MYNMRAYGTLEKKETHLTNPYNIHKSSLPGQTLMRERVWLNSFLWPNTEFLGVLIDINATLQIHVYYIHLKIIGCNSHFDVIVQHQLDIQVEVHSMC